MGSACQCGGSPTAYSVQLPTEGHKTIEVTNKVTCEKLPKVKVKLTKKWSGDDHGGAEVRFSVNDTLVRPGPVDRCLAYAGQTVTISETVSACRMHLRVEPAKGHLRSQG